MVAFQWHFTFLCFSGSVAIFDVFRGIFPTGSDKIAMIFYWITVLTQFFPETLKTTVAQTNFEILEIM